MDLDFYMVFYINELYISVVLLQQLHIVSLKDIKYIYYQLFSILDMYFYLLFYIKESVVLQNNIRSPACIPT